jgi:hypothetical protein
MSHTPRPNEPAPICKQCNREASWDSKWGDWWCFECDDETELIQAIEKELK